MSEQWRIIPDKSKEHWLEVEDPQGGYSAAVKWDGCIHYYSNYLGDEESDYLHICNLDDEIKRLEALRELAITYFESHGREWPGA